MEKQLDVTLTDNSELILQITLHNRMQLLHS